MMIEGTISRRRIVAVCNSPGSKPPTRTGASQGAPIMSATVTNRNTTVESESRVDITSPSSPCRSAESSAVYSLSTGTNAAESMPPTSSS